MMRIASHRLPSIREEDDVAEVESPSIDWVGIWRDELLLVEYNSRKSTNTLTRRHGKYCYQLQSSRFSHSDAQHILQSVVLWSLPFCQFEEEWVLGETSLQDEYGPLLRHEIVQLQRNQRTMPDTVRRRRSRKPNEDDDNMRYLEEAARQHNPYQSPVKNDDYCFLSSPVTVGSSLASPTGVADVVRVPPLEELQLQESKTLDTQHEESNQEEPQVVVVVVTTPNASFVDDSSTDFCEAADLILQDLELQHQEPQSSRQEPCCWFWLPQSRKQSVFL